MTAVGPMKVKLTREAAIRFAKGTILEVSEEEASRLVAFNLAEVVKEKTARTAKKK